MKDSVTRFSNRVENYARYRPGYPPAILKLLQRECGLSQCSVIADIGSGTGLLTELLCKSGNTVFAVEPNAAMRQEGERRLRRFAGVSCVAGTAEATPLRSASVDFVTAGQAFHWFDRSRARREFVRILRPGGWVVLVWNARRLDSTPFLAAYERLVVEFGSDYHEVGHQDLDQEVADFFAPAAFCEKVYASRQVFGWEGLKGRLLSSSYVPPPGHPAHAPMLQELRAIFRDHQVNGKVTLEYDTRIYYGQLC